MDRKKLIPFINAENEMAGSVISLADRYSCEGADGLYLYNFSGDDKSREEFLGVVRSIEKQIDVPFVVGLYVERFEDAISRRLKIVHIKGEASVSEPRTAHRSPAQPTTPIDE